MVEIKNNKIKKCLGLGQGRGQGLGQGRGQGLGQGRGFGLGLGRKKIMRKAPFAFTKENGTHVMISEVSFVTGSHKSQPNPIHSKRSGTPVISTSLMVARLSISFIDLTINLLMLITAPINIFAKLQVF